MYNILSYPLITIYTNRIAGTPTFAQVGENLPKEFLTVVERGGSRAGFFRGFLPFLIYGNCHKNMSEAGS